MNRYRISVWVNHEEEPSTVYERTCKGAIHIAQDRLTRTAMRRYSGWKRIEIEALKNTGAEMVSINEMYQPTTLTQSGGEVR